MRVQSSARSFDAPETVDGAGDTQPTTGSYVLVVDDEAIVRAFVARCLEGEGYAVKQADGAAEALELMMSEPAAVVLCDIRMPGRDGFWLAERVHSHWPHVPIVMATALDDPHSVQKSRSAGAVDYIAKPITPQQVLEVVRRVTNTQVLRQPDAPEVARQEQTQSGDDHVDAEYALETPVRCPACGERVDTLRAVRLIRTRVNFTSTLPRRGRVVACPHCLAIVPADLTNF